MSFGKFQIYLDPFLLNICPPLHPTSKFLKTPSHHPVSLIQLDRTNASRTVVLPCLLSSDLQLYSHPFPRKLQYGNYRLDLLRLLNTTLDPPPKHPQLRRTPRALT